MKRIVGFADLKLARDPDGGVSFDWDVIGRICAASNLPPEILRDAPEENVAGLIMGWYRSHLNAGGEPDPVAEDLISETHIEDERGQHASHQPGRA